MSNNNQSGLEIIQRLNGSEFYPISSVQDNQEQAQQAQMMDANISFEWEYQMRREMQEIIPGVYLGPYAAALRSAEAKLDSAGVTHIVCVRQDIESHWIKPNMPEKYRYLIVEISDTPTTPIIPHFHRVREFLDQCLMSGHKALVHGNAGISRSAALVIAYVMEKCGILSADAIRIVQRKRFCIFPNEGFRRQLMEYEPIIRARQAHDLHDQTQSGLKRPYLEEENIGSGERTRPAQPNPESDSMNH